MNVLPLDRPFFVKLNCDRVEVGLGLLKRNSGLQTTHHQKRMTPTLSQVVTARHRLPHHHCRNPPVNSETAQQPCVFFRRDADDGEGMTVEFDAAAYDPGIPAEARLPELMTDNSDRSLAGPSVLFRQKAASEQWYETKGGKVVSADDLSKHTLVCPVNIQA